MSNQIGKIVLIGISPEYSRKGIGTKLLHAILRIFKRKKCKKVEVVTQGKNIPALNLYLKVGFIIEKVELWYHKWF